MIRFSICLSDIPAESRKTANNGKVYADFVIDSRKEPDQYGNTHSVCMSQTKEERDAKNPKKYVGNGKEYLFNNNTSQQTTSNSQPHNENIDPLPF